MIRLSRLSDYAVVLMTHMARAGEDVHNAHDLSSLTRLPAPTVSKILAILSRAEILESLRGRQGGYRLLRSPADISVEDIITAVDGPIALTLCVEQGPTSCEVHQFCPSSVHWHRINAAIRGALAGVSLADLADPVPHGEAAEQAQEVGAAAQ